MDHDGFEHLPRWLEEGLDVVENDYRHEWEPGMEYSMIRFHRRNWELTVPAHYFPTAAVTAITIWMGLPALIEWIRSGLDRKILWSRETLDAANLALITPDIGYVPGPDGIRWLVRKETRWNEVYRTKSGLPPGALRRLVFKDTPVAEIHTEYVGSDRELYYESDFATASDMFASDWLREPVEVGLIPTYDDITHATALAMWYDDRREPELSGKTFRNPAWKRRAPAVALWVHARKKA